MIMWGRDSQGTMTFWGATVNNGYGGGDRKIEGFLMLASQSIWIREVWVYLKKKKMPPKIMPRDIEKATWHLHPHLSTCKYTHTCTWESMKLWRWNIAYGMWVFFWSHDPDLWVTFIHLHTMCVAAWLSLTEGPNEHIPMQEHTECLEPNEVTINICPRHGLTV